ncbi:metallophosphoesterase family protein [Micromonospora musae]|uniref:metallophosphoesterase family protein n=1 Tax=Micromonospora musae TaxID=1894970 RepID=UPI003F4D78DE
MRASLHVSVSGEGWGAVTASAARWARRGLVALAMIIVTLVGVTGGTMLGGRVTGDVGPLRVEFQLSPSTDGGSEIAVPPLGSLFLDSHSGPARLTARLDSLDQKRAEALIHEPGGLAAAGASAPSDIRDALLRLGLRTVAASVLGTMLLAALTFRSTRRTAWAGTLALAVTGGALGAAALTVRPAAVAEPRYEGLLVNAPALVGDARRIADDYTRYADQLQRLVGNVSKLYGTMSSLPVYEASADTTRILHVSDLHLNPAVWPVIKTVVEQFDIDLVIDTGDITDWGSEPETSYVSMIGQLKVPYVYIRGNHDSPRTAQAVAGQPNAVVLDNSITSVSSVRIAGIGDPRFTPDKQEQEGGPWDEGPTSLPGSGQRLADTIRAAGAPVDIALVHDPASADPLAGTAPLILAGHTHQREVRMLPGPEGEPGSRLAVQGSTGGAGLRGLQGEEPTPLAMSVLYLGPNHRLEAYDDIRVGGTGLAQVSLDRQVIDPDVPADVAGAGAGGAAPETPVPAATTPPPAGARSD